MNYLMFSEQSRYQFDWESFQPVTNYAESEQDIQGLFGIESYYHAVYILFMFEKALSEATFRKGAINYLKKLQYSAADKDDLFDSLQAAATEDQVELFKESGAVSKSMKTWMHLYDYPVLIVTRDYENGSFTLQHKRFNNKNDTEVESDDLWYIPITLTTASNPDFNNLTTDFVFPNEENITITPDDYKPLLKGDRIILNKQQIGTYRVQYDERNWKLIIQENPAVIHSYNKAQLLRDATTFVKANILSDRIFFDLLLCMKDDDDLVAWSEAENSLYHIRENLTGVGSKQIFEFFAQDFISNIFDKTLLNSKVENILREHMRSVLFGSACEVNLDKCIKARKMLFEDIFANKTNMDLRFKKVIYFEGFKRSKKEDFENLLHIFEKEDDILELTALIEGLMLYQNVKFIEYLVTNLINKSFETSEEDSKEEDDEGIYLYRMYLRDWEFNIYLNK